MFKGAVGSTRSFHRRREGFSDRLPITHARELRMMTADPRAQRTPIGPDDVTSDQTYRHRVFDGMALRRKNLDNCTFTGCSFANADLTGARLNASVFRTCNLSNARIAGSNLFSTAFEECRMVGLDFREGLTLTATTFKACILDYAIFRGVSLEKKVFEQCSLVEAALSLTNLRQASFDRCDLTRADIQEAAFFQTDLRGANLTGWNLKRHDLRGTIVTTAQLETLAAELGILIIDP